MGFLYFLLPVLILSLWAQSRLSSTYKRYSRVASKSGLSGAQAAAAILKKAQVEGVSIVPIGGHLTDHYDPLSKRLALSEKNFSGTSLAALGVAAHEAGHAIQHKVGYKALKLRALLVPVTQIASRFLPFVIIGGFFFGILGLAKIGVWCYLAIAAFQLVTLPVEFDASARARRQLLACGILREEEIGGVVKTLNAAGFTYVAAFVGTLVNLVYLFLMTRD